MVKSAPAASFIVSQTEFLFQFLIVSFDDPSMLGPIDQLIEREIFRKRG
jgi:hypothetical protein